MAYYGTSTDIDDLKQAEAAHDSPDRAAEHGRPAVPHGRLGAGAARHAFRWSQEASFVLELPPGSAPTLDTAIGLCTPQSQALASRVAQECVENGTPFDVEVEMVTGTGRNIWVRSMGRAVRNGAGPDHPHAGRDAGRHRAGAGRA